MKNEKKYQIWSSFFSIYFFFLTFLYNLQILKGIDLNHL